jgi:RNA polymerase sigma-70 factor (sigma-E family)
MAEDAGDAFGRFVREQTPTLYRSAYLLTGNAHEAEELLQDTLTRLYPKWHLVTGADSPLAYVRRALTNRFISDRRAPLRRDTSLWELPETPDGHDVGESVAVSATIWQLLGTLPPKQRAAVVLRYFSDLPDEETAAAIGCRPVTVRSLVSRGIATLRAGYLAGSAAAEGSLR